MSSFIKARDFDPETTKVLRPLPGSDGFLAVSVDGSSLFRSSLAQFVKLNPSGTHHRLQSVARRGDGAIFGVSATGHLVRVAVDVSRGCTRETVIVSETIREAKMCSLEAQPDTLRYTPPQAKIHHHGTPVTHVRGCTFASQPEELCTFSVSCLVFKISAQLNPPPSLLLHTLRTYKI